MTNHFGAAGVAVSVKSALAKPGLEAVMVTVRATL